MKYRVSKRTGKFAGLNQTKDEINKKFNLILTKEPYNLSDNIIFLGEIERNNDFEKEDNLPSIDEMGKTYKHFDDSGIVIKIPKGIIVISGCSHSGICNIIEYAKKVTNMEKVFAVIGGFHLKELNNQTNKTIDYFINNNIGNIYLAHCTSDIVCEEFKKRIPKNVKIISSDVCLNIDE